MTVPAGRARTAALVAVLLAVAAASQFSRSSHAVVAPDIATELGLPIEALGIMGGVLFLAATVSLLPFGGLIDAWGARPLLAGKLAIAAAGSLAFAAAQSLEGLVVGRMLLGIGGAALIMGVLVIASRWLPPSGFGTVVGLTLAVSHLGNLAATAPMSWLVERVGWRTAFGLQAAALAALAVVLVAVVREAPAGHAYHGQARPRALQSMSGVGAVLRLPGFWRVMAMGFASYAAFVTMLAVWAAPYLRDRFGMDASARGQVLLVMTAGVIAGNVLFGLADRWVRSRKTLVYAGGVTIVGIFALLSVRASNASVVEITLLFALLGATSCYSATLISHGRSMYPDSLIGRGMTTLNMSVLGGAAVLQLVSAWIAKPFGTPAGGLTMTGYSVVFAALGAWVVAGLVLYVKAPESAGGGAARAAAARA